MEILNYYYIFVNKYFNVFIKYRHKIILIDNIILYLFLKGYIIC
jgi:hypothetical protein